MTNIDFDDNNLETLKRNIKGSSRTRTRDLWLWRQAR